MSKLLSYFPNSRVSKGNIVGLIIAILIYVVVAAVLGWVVSLLSGIAVIGMIAGILSTLIWIYEVVGIVLAILSFVGIK